MKFRAELLVAFLVGLPWFSLQPDPCVADTLTISIAQSADDAEEDITGPLMGNVRRTSSDLEIGNENGVEHWVGLRFQNIAIAPGSIVNSASIRFTAKSVDVGTLTIPVLGELAVDAVQFGDLTPLTTRTLTSANTIWEIDPWFPNDFGPNTTTPDLAVIVQEIVDQAGWVSGNSMAFILQNDPGDTSERVAHTFDADPLLAGVLSVDFTPPSVPVLADSLTVVRGVQTGGTLEDVHTSDNVDVSIRRNQLQTSAVIEVEFSAASPVANPTRFEFSLEAAGFYRTTVVQSIEFFDYTLGEFVEFDSRNAPRFSDGTTIASGTGDLSRFVESGTGLTRTKVIFDSINRRQSFSVGIDQIFWFID